MEVCGDNDRFAHRYVQALRASIRRDHAGRRYSGIDCREDSTGSRTPNTRQEALPSSNRDCPSLPKKQTREICFNWISK